MIQVTVSRDHNNITGFEIAGHADSGPYGYDLVCAGVSAVSFGAINAIEELCDIEPHIHQSDDGGYIRVDVPSSLADTQFDNVQILLQGMLVSLKTIEREYGEFIQIH